MVHHLCLSKTLLQAFWGNLGEPKVKTYSEEVYSRTFSGANYKLFGPMVHHLCLLLQAFWGNLREPKAKTCPEEVYSRTPSGAVY